MTREAKLHSLRRAARAHYLREGRVLPWRGTRDPYKILVSEVMLQQTQVDRVRVKYAEFLKKFPTVRALSRAPLRDVLAVWQGLGYNRRALMLHRAAKEIVKKHRGHVPRSVAELDALPGVGHNTACAVAAFAYNEPVVFIETNIRSVFIHYFFPRKKEISDRELLPLVERTLDKRNPREWYWALMDYGTHLKKLHKNPSRRSVHYKKQSPFKGSDREIRGKILRLKLVRPSLNLQSLITLVGSDPARTKKIIQQLKKEGFLVV